MLLTDINIDDLKQLERLRIERIQLFFASSLPHCLLQINGENILTIYCLYSETVDELLDDFDDLCSHAWLILGVNKISLYFGLEEILSRDFSAIDSARDRPINLTNLSEQDFFNLGDRSQD